MTSIADNIPLEILREIFEHIETSFSILDADITRSMRHDHIEPSGVPYTAPGTPTPSVAFINYRLVSRKWKLVADTFFFREPTINLGFDRPIVSRPKCDKYYLEQSKHHPGAQIMKLLLDRDYTSLVRQLHVSLNMDKRHCPSNGDSQNWGERDIEAFDNILIQFRRILLEAKSCSVLHLYLQLGPPALPVTDKVIQTTIDTIHHALQRSPYIQLDLSICFPNDPWRLCELNVYGGLVYFPEPERQEQYLTSHVPHEVFSLTRSLDLEIHLPLSPRLFNSFRSVKTLSLHKVIQECTPEEIQTIENGVMSMPCLENLVLCHINVISVFPSRLRTLRMMNLEHQDLKFWRNLSQLENLEVLQLCFFGSSRMVVSGPYPDDDEPIDWSQMPTPNLSKLQILEVATCAVAPNATAFCELVLAKSSVLNHVKVVGLAIKDNHLTNIRTQSLESLVLTYHDRDVSLVPEAVWAHVIKCGPISWSAIKTVLNKNPRIRILQLGLDPQFLAAFTFEDIDEISMSSQELERILIHQGDMEIEQRELFSENSAAVIASCGWLYIKSSGPDNSPDVIMKKILRMPRGRYYETQEFILDLEKFRRLRRRLLAGSL